MLINADIGEKTGNDAIIIPHIDIGNIACGYHSSDPEHMAETVRLAIAHGVKISAHPSYLDRENFGRISHSHNHSEILQLMETQVQLLVDICSKEGAILYSIKPHGALYHDMIKLNHVRKAIIATTHKYAVQLIVPAEKTVWSIPVLKEVFADRTYMNDGSLAPRSLKGALHLDSQKIVTQAHKFIKQNNADTLCFHGDNPASVKALTNLYVKN